MATLGFQILLESARELVEEVYIHPKSFFVEYYLHIYIDFVISLTCVDILQTHPNKDHDSEMWVISIIVFVTAVKFILMVYCRRFKNEIVRAYAQDHFFDVITNSVGLGATVLAIRYKWWIDPVGAIIVSTW